MKHYNLKEIKKCYVYGSIDKNINRFFSIITSNLSNYEKEEHPKEKERQEKLREHINEIAPRTQRLSNPTLSTLLKKKRFLKDAYDNSLVIVSGNCGIGSKELGYYHALFEKYEKHLAKNNCYIFFVRGNSDDPSIFNDCKIDFEHIKTIPDYSVISLKYYNCLCIGGCISIDKSWKIFQEKEFGKKTFWEEEKPTFQKDILENILNEYEIKCIVTSSCPSFAYPGTNHYNHTKWIKKDKSIQKSFIEERKILDNIYSAIIEKDSKPYVWFYGRFGTNNVSKINDIVFSSLGKFQFSDANELIRTNFGVQIEDELGKNVYSLDDDIFKTITWNSNESLQARYNGGTTEADPIMADVDEEEAVQELEDEDRQNHIDAVNAATRTVLDYNNVTFDYFAPTINTNGLGGIPINNPF